MTDKLITSDVEAHGFRSGSPFERRADAERHARTIVIREGSGNNHNETVVRMTPVIAEAFTQNHNETVVRITPVIAEAFTQNHNETVVRVSVR